MKTAKRKEQSGKRKKTFQKVRRSLLLAQG
jgi:hypothetical protein